MSDYEDIMRLAGVEDFEESLDPELSVEEDEEYLVEEEPDENRVFSSKQELDKAIQNDYNTYPHWFFAFDKKQFDDGFKKLGLERGVDKVISIGAGGYIPVKYKEEFEAMCEKHEKWKKEFRKQRRMKKD